MMPTLGDRLSPSLKTERDRVPMVADLYCDLDVVTGPKWRSYWRGLCIVCAATLATAYLAEQYSAPITLMALLVGLSLNFLGDENQLAPGIAFASRDLLRWGIVLVGCRVTFGQMIDLGPAALACVIGIAAMTIGTGLAVARVLKVPPAFGLLAGASVAICGASAALAVAAALGEKRISRIQLAQVLVVIAMTSAAAMFLYPILAHALAFDDKQAGFLLGAAIHDVGQAIGAGYAYSPTAGENAAIVKLSRVALLGPLLALVAYFYPGTSGRGRIVPVPGFVIGFFALAMANSLGWVPAMVAGLAGTAATACLAAAVAATGIRAPLRELSHSGMGAFMIIGLATLTALGLSALAAGFVIH